MINSFTERWRQQLKHQSGTLTTNERMPENLIDILLDDDETLAERLAFDEIKFPQLQNELDSIQGLNVLAAIQRRKRPGCITVFRSMRFPTHKRLHHMVTQAGYAFSNYEQERILELYSRPDYNAKRSDIQRDHRFRTQLQERVVAGLPIFGLVNDAIQIHHAFRGNEDRVAVCAIHIPMTLIQRDLICFVANAPIDTTFDAAHRDYRVNCFKSVADGFTFDTAALRAQGIELYEIYVTGLPWTLQAAGKMQIAQDYYVLDITHVNDALLQEIRTRPALLKHHSDFLHGLFGDQFVTGRRAAGHLPSRCYGLTLR